MTDFNPYAPPQAPLAQALPLRRATRGQRFGTFLIDMVFYYLLAICVGVVLAVAGVGDALDSVPDPVIGAIILSIYYIPQEFYTGRTLGKRIMKTQVVNDIGGLASLKQVVGRTLCRMIPFEAFSFLAAEEGGPRGWHDRLPKTFVVSTRDA
jgi:uncharacterized RDD family membrane protein YckC